MDGQANEGILRFFGDLPDPRAQRDPQAGTPSS